jgi:hypothetical protein
MEEAPAENVIVVDYCSREWARLIRKLRWIGLEEEAHRLELAVSTLPAEERGSVLAGPVSID